MPEEGTWPRPDPGDPIQPHVPRGTRIDLLDREQRLDQPAVALDAKLRDTLAGSVREAGYPVHRMTSGAGHDAMILAPHVPAAMLSLRSPDGVSHHPDESVVLADVEAAIEVGLRFIQNV